MNTVIFMINAILQVVVFSLIPLIWWAITCRKKCSFFGWIGLKKVKTDSRKRIIILFIATVILLAIPTIFIVPNFAPQSEMATAQFAGKGFSVLLPAAIYSFIQTGLSEEIFFRGFIGKRLVNRFGLNIGNLIQGILFGLLHGVMFVSIAGLFGSVIIIFITGTAGYVMGYINENLSEGSIVPSWLLHGCANLCASLIAMFNIT